MRCPSPSKAHHRRLRISAASPRHPNLVPDAGRLWHHFFQPDSASPACSAMARDSPNWSEARSQYCSGNRPTQPAGIESHRIFRAGLGSSRCSACLHNHTGSAVYRAPGATIPRSVCSTRCVAAKSVRRARDVPWRLAQTPVQEVAAQALSLLRLVVRGPRPSPKLFPAQIFCRSIQMHPPRLACRHLSDGNAGKPAPAQRGSRLRKSFLRPSRRRAPALP